MALIRKLEPQDFFKGYLDLLSQLTSVGNISYNQFVKTFELLNSDIYVIEENNQIIATGTLLIEQKFIHACGKVGHIEDIVVDRDHRGKYLGYTIVNFLINKGKYEGCYKVILDCNNENIAFYQKLGFEIKEIEMAMYFK